MSAPCNFRGDDCRASVHAGDRQLLSATYTADGERITKSDPITGAHVNSHGLHDTNRNTVYPPRARTRKRSLTTHLHSSERRNLD